MCLLDRDVQVVIVRRPGVPQPSRPRQVADGGLAGIQPRPAGSGEAPLQY
jgi:hypothetical protein